jgi:hypothetical protein
MKMIRPIMANANMPSKKITTQTLITILFLIDVIYKNLIFYKIY